MGWAAEWIEQTKLWVRGAEGEKGDAQHRPLAQRLEATLRRGEEALSPRELRRLLLDMQQVADTALSDVEGGRHAQLLMDWYAKADLAARKDFWLLAIEKFGPDAKALQAARERYDKAGSDVERSEAEMSLRRALVSSRTRLLQRFAQPKGGMGFLVDMRAELLALPKAEQHYVALDAELEHLFSSWFDVALLELRSLNWDSPASLLEKLIQYEAVHDIRSWADLKNRLDSDRRCYGFFHPRMPNVPLIFVEVALLDRMAGSMAPLLDEGAAAADLAKANTAIFYSISNTQTGLKGVSFGDSLIKHVVETLTQEFPKLKQFATLSPIPGFADWLRKRDGESIDRVLGVKRLARWREQHGEVPADGAAWFSVLSADTEDTVIRDTAMTLAAHYLVREGGKGVPADPVARFHLGNGACVERVNWGADMSRKGRAQSCGMMVNYLYVPDALDDNLARLGDGNPRISRAVAKLL